MKIFICMNMSKKPVKLSGSTPDDIHEIGKAVDGFMRSHRDYNALYEKYRMLHIALHDLYANVMIPFARGIGNNDLTMFSELQLAWIRRQSWPADRRYSDQIWLAINNKNALDDKIMMDAYNTLNASLAVAYLMKLSEGLVGFRQELTNPVIDAKGQPTKYMFSEKKLGLDALRDVAERIVTSHEIALLFKFTPDLMNVDPADVVMIAGLLEEISKLDLTALFRDLSRATGEDDVYLRGSMIVVRWVRKIVIGSGHVCIAIMKPDFAFDFLTNITSMIFEQEGPSFKKEHKSGMETLLSSTDLFRERMPDYYENYVINGDPTEMTRMFIMDVMGKLEEGKQDTNGIHLLVSQLIKRASNKIKDADDRNPQKAMVMKTINNLTKLTDKLGNSITNKTAGMSQEVKDAMIRNGRV